jgi:protein involved in polysaccharide export with SLBB domain
MNTTMRNGDVRNRRSRRQWFVQVAAAFSLALICGLYGCSTGTPPIHSLPVAENPPDYKMGPGDRISVTVFGEDNITGEYDVDPQGTVSLPLAGRMKVKDMTAQQFEAALTNRLGHGLVTNPQVAVAVVKYRPFYILGEVKNPGAYPYYSGATVLNAVALAGGYTYRASTSNISVVRPDSKDHDPQLASEEAYLEPGDIVIVPLRWF